MSRAEVIASVLSIGEHMVPEGVDLEALHHLTALAILGALSEYAAGERTVATTKLFDRLRATGSPAPVAERVETAGSGDPLAPDPASPVQTYTGSTGHTYVVDAWPPQLPNERSVVDDGEAKGCPSAIDGDGQHPQPSGRISALAPAATDAGSSSSETDRAAEVPGVLAAPGAALPVLPPSLRVEEPETPGAEPFACSGCGKTFDTTSALGNHRRICAGFFTSNPAPASRRPPAEPIGEHPCQYCDRVFPSQRALIGHQSFCAGAKAARLAKRQGARIPDPPAAALGPPEPVETTVDQIPPGMALLCSTCDTVYRNAAVLNSHTHRAHGRTATREERTPQRVEAVG